MMLAVSMSQVRSTPAGSRPSSGAVGCSWPTDRPGRVGGDAGQAAAEPGALGRRQDIGEPGQSKVALVVDDLVSTDPWTPRFLRVYGTAELIERPGRFGPGAYLRITPDISWSWNLDGRPYGDEAVQQGPRRTVHRP
jgi:hypothetical protein